MTEGFIPVAIPPNLVRFFNGNGSAAIFFACLLRENEAIRSCNEFINHEKHGGGWFKFTVRDMEETYLFGKKKQDKIIKTCISLGLFECKKFGEDNKRHFRFTEKNRKIIQGIYKMT